MTINEVKVALRGISHAATDQQDINQIRQQLEDCLWALRRETGFQDIPSGAPTPLMRYAIVEAEESVDQAIKSIEQNDKPAMLLHVEKAVACL